MRAAIVGRLRAAGCVFAEDEADLLIAAAPTPDRLEDMVQLRASGLPLEHVIGWAEFCGLRITDHAQYEIRVYAQAMLTLARQVAPISVEAWEQNRGVAK